MGWYYHKNSELYVPFPFCANRRNQKLTLKVNRLSLWLTSSIAKGHKGSFRSMNSDDCGLGVWIGYIIGKDRSGVGNLTQYSDYKIRHS